MHAMGKKFAVSALALMLLGSFCGCSSKSIEAEYKSVYADTMECMAAPENEGEYVSETEDTEPEFEKLVLTRGTNIAYVISVASIKEDKVEFKYDENCISARIYSVNEDGYNTFLREGENGKVSLQRGEELMIEEIGLLDASHTVYIRLK